MQTFIKIAPVALCLALCGCAEVGNIVFPPLTVTSAENVAHDELERCLRDEVATVDANGNTLACVPPVAFDELHRRKDLEAKRTAEIKANDEVIKAKEASDRAAEWRREAPKRAAAANQCKRFVYDVKEKYNFGAVVGINGNQMYNSVYTCQAWYKDLVTGARNHFVFLQGNVNNEAYEINTIY